MGDSTDTGGLTAEDVAAIAMLGNNALLQWYQVTHNQVPGSGVAVQVGGGGITASGQTSTLLLLGLVVLGAVYFLK